MIEVKRSNSPSPPTNSVPNRIKTELDQEEKNIFDEPVSLTKERARIAITPTLVAKNMATLKPKKFSPFSVDSLLSQKEKKIEVDRDDFPTQKLHEQDRLRVDRDQLLRAKLNFDSDEDVRARLNNNHDLRLSVVKAEEEIDVCGEDDDDDVDPDGDPDAEDRSFEDEEDKSPLSSGSGAGNPAHSISHPTALHPRFSFLPGSAAAAAAAAAAAGLYGQPHPGPGFPGMPAGPLPWLPQFKSPPLSHHTGRKFYFLKTTKSTFKSRLLFRSQP